ncbi:MAG: hypothetical protein AB1429_09250 [Pseudomonadota bacterium]|jgi:hypothetical protein
MAAGCVGLLMLGVQPMVLGALVAEHRLSMQALAQAATVEMLGLGIVSGGLGALLQHRHLRIWGAGACIALAAANLGCLSATGVGLIALRAAAGAAGGVLLWITTGLTTRHPAAVRLSALFFGSSALTQAALAAVIPVFAPFFGANAGLVLLAGLALLSLPLVLCFPHALPDLAKSAPGQGALSRAGGFGLLATFLLMAGIVGLWVFIDQLGRAYGVAKQTVALAIAASLAAQVAGAGLVGWIGPRISPPFGLAVVGLALIACVGALAFDRHVASYVSGTLAVGFLWPCAMVMFVPLLIRLDPTRRAAMLLPGVQLLGSGAGPVVTGAFARSAELSPVLAAAAALFGAGVLAILAAVVAQRGGQGDPIGVRTIA